MQCIIPTPNKWIPFPTLLTFYYYKFFFRCSGACSVSKSQWIKHRSTPGNISNLSCNPWLTSCVSLNVESGSITISTSIITPCVRLLEKGVQVLNGMLCRYRFVLFGDRGLVLCTLLVGGIYDLLRCRLIIVIHLRQLSKEKEYDKLLFPIIR